MLPNILLRVPDVAALTLARRFACALLLAASTLANAAASAPPPALPAEAVALVPGARLIGSATLTFIGLKIYDGYYYSANKRYSPQEPFALVLSYHRNLRGEAIANRSIDEIERLDIGSPAQRERWCTIMKGMFPDVHPGDVVTGVNVPGGATQFFRNGKPIGSVDDPAFGAAFFAIWFDPRTSRPELRERLLGG